jgi:hypothetical protein
MKTFIERAAFAFHLKKHEASKDEVLSSYFVSFVAILSMLFILFLSQPLFVLFSQLIYTFQYASVYMKNDVNKE